MTSNFEKSFKAKLRAMAKQSRRDPADLWQTLMLERFLARLEQSQYSYHVGHRLSLKYGLSNIADRLHIFLPKTTHDWLYNFSLCC